MWSAMWNPGANWALDLGPNKTPIKQDIPDAYWLLKGQPTGVPERDS